MAVLTLKCKNCDGPVTFQAKKGRYVCEYCRSTFAPEEFEQAAQEDMTEAASGASHSDTAAAEMQQQTAAQQGNAEEKEDKEQALYICPSCGAQIMTEKTTAATSCYFCHNPVVLSDRLDGSDMPDLVLPFEISEKEAKSRFKSWVKEHKYVPKDFYSESQVKRLTGVYFPYWVYDCEVEGQVLGKGEKIRSWDSAGMRNKETSVYRLFKEGTMKISHVTRIALNKASKVLVEGVMPFEIDKAKKFSMGYLQGYLAEVKDIEKENMQEEVCEEVRQYAYEQIRQSASQGYDNVSFDVTKVDLSDEKWRYALMPVYTVTYHDRKDNKLYYFSINGQTGKICGELPVDEGAIRGLFLKTAIPVLVGFLALFFVL